MRKRSITTGRESLALFKVDTSRTLPEMVVCTDEGGRVKSVGTKAWFVKKHALTWKNRNNWRTFDDVVATYRGINISLVQKDWNIIGDALEGSRSVCYTTTKLSHKYPSEIKMRLFARKDYKVCRLFNDRVLTFFGIRHLWCKEGIGERNADIFTADGTNFGIMPFNWGSDDE